MEREQTYGVSMRRLNEIVARMESGRMDVDELCEATEEAALLVADCRKRLRGVEKRVCEAIGTMEDSDRPEENTDFVLDAEGVEENGEWPWEIKESGLDEAVESP